VRPFGGVGVEAACEDELEEGEDVVVAVVAEFLGSVEPVVGVLLVLVDLAPGLLVEQEEGKLTVKNLVGDHPQRKDVVLLGKGLGRVEALRGAVGHGEAGSVVYFGRGLLLGQMAGW
jgi:hypothetical protein